MLVLADGLFRLDITVSGDTLRTVVRNFTSDELTMSGGVYGPEGANVIVGEATAYQPSRAAVEFAIGSVQASVTLGTLRFADRGTVRVSAQAIVRQTALP
ncbi:MAG: hypothetical protein ACXVFQ_24060 [Solirubrobacteraceae bacterium]